MSDLVLMAVGGGGAAVGGYVAVIVANKTNIEWIKKELGRIERVADVAHARIDKVLQELNSKHT